MHILLLTGIYPPEIGGPATYSYNLAKELTAMGHKVTVLSYGEEYFNRQDGWEVYQISREGNVFSRYWRMRSAIRKHGLHVDLVYNFGTVSTGIPLWFASGIRAPKILRLGGDFAWERYTDLGGNLPLPRFYTEPKLHWRLVQLLMKPLLKQHKHVVFSTTWQQNIYRNYITLKSQSHLANAVHASSAPVAHELHNPIKLLSFGRMVKFKRITNLVAAMAFLPNAELTIAGDGPELEQLQAQVEELGLQNRVRFKGKVNKEQKRQLFNEHDLLVIPSLSDISPNAALEAMASGLPVVLSDQNGLSETVQQSMYVCSLQTPEAISKAVLTAIEQYDELKTKRATVPERSWHQVATEHVELFRDLIG